jgi:hypothetical protein
VRRLLVRVVLLRVRQLVRVQHAGPQMLRHRIAQPDLRLLCCAQPQPRGRHRELIPRRQRGALRQRRAARARKLAPHALQLLQVRPGSRARSGITRVGACCPGGQRAQRRLRR